jgi:hypothetical protein
MPEHPHTTPESHTLRADSSKGELPPELRERIARAFGIPEERLERLRMIAQVVGGDFGMAVALGMPGQGSFFSPEENRIAFDPLHLADPEREQEAEFVAAHEGGHRAITRGPETIGLKPEKVRELYGHLGFAFGANACEDPADNNWWARKYEGLGETVAGTYDPMFAEDAAILGTPEIHQMIQQRGVTPRFAHFGSEVIRLWHTGEYSTTGLPDDVMDALERVRDAVREYVADIPSDHPREAEVIERARSRFRTFHDRIWPEMRRLVEEDLKDERVRQMAEEAMAAEQQEAGEGEGSGSGAGSSLDGLSDALKRELEETMRDAAAQAAQEAEEAGAAAAEQAEQDAEALRAALQQLQQAAGDASKSDDEREQAQQGIASMEEALKGVEGKAEAMRADAEAAAARLRGDAPPRPVPLDQLSDELLRALEEAYAKLPAAERERLEEQARRALEELESAMNAELQGKLVRDADKPESHDERHEREEHEQEEDALRREEEREREEASLEIQRALEQQRTPYDRAYEQVVPLINRLTDDFERLFQKERHPRWRGSFPTGGRLDLRRVMQYEADPSQYTKLWERKTIPEKHDRTFTILVDLSGSMWGKKIEETFKAAILVVESLARVGIATEILGFQDELIVFKDAEEPMSDIVRQRMSGMVAEVSDTNPGGRNQAAHNDDGYCLDRATARIRERVQKEKFLVVLSDGRPKPSRAHSGARWELGAIVEQIKAQGDVKLVGVGIGPNTEHVRDYYPNSVIGRDVREFPEDLATLLEDMIVNPEYY